MNTLNKILQDKDSATTNPVFLALIAIGIFIKLALSIGTSEDGSLGPANSLIWGYGIVLFSMIGIIFMNIETGTDTYSDIKKLPWTMILSIIIIMWTISLNFKYFTSINRGTVPYQYYLWSTYSTILIIAMILISLFQYTLQRTTDKDLKEYGKQILIYSAIIFIFNIICVTIQQIILDCFTVDG